MPASAFLTPLCNIIGFDGSTHIHRTPPCALSGWNSEVV